MNEITKQDRDLLFERGGNVGHALHQVIVKFFSIKTKKEFDYVLDELKWAYESLENIINYERD